MKNIEKEIRITTFNSIYPGTKKIQDHIENKQSDKFSCTNYYYDFKVT